MGFKRSTSFQMVPGVRVRVSTSGVSVNGRRVTGSSGSGRSSTRARSAPQPRYTPPPPSAPKPGWLSSSEEKSLFAAVVERKAMDVDDTVRFHPNFAKVAHALLGLRMLEAGQLDRAADYLQYAISAPGDIVHHPFVQKYLPDFDYELSIYDGISASLPMGDTLLRLAGAEALQALGRLQEAAQLVEDAMPSAPAALSLADLYGETGRWDEVVELTDGLTVQDELTAGLALLRGEAQMNLANYTAAKECIKSLTTSRKLGDDIRHAALALRAEIQAAEGAFGRARADLEKILAENSRYPGLKDALADLHHREDAATTAKEQEKQRLAAEKERTAAAKREEQERAREEKKAEAERLRAERAQTRQPRPAPAAAQAGFIDLTAEEGTPVVPSRAASSQAATAEEPAADAETNDEPGDPGFYPDPEGVAPFRYWDGTAWTSRVRMTR